MASIGAEGPTDLTVQPPVRRDLSLAPATGSYGYGNTKPASTELSLGLLWRVAVEWRWLILAAFGVGIAAAVLVTLLSPFKYMSVATIELNPPQVEVLDNDKSGDRDPSVYDENFIGTQLGLLQSRALAERVAQDLNLAANPAIVGSTTDRATGTAIAAGYVQGGLSARVVPQSRLVRLTFVSRDPAIAARAVNGAADAYINTTLERRYQSSSYARDFLQRQIATTRSSLERSEKQLVAYAQQQRIIDMGGENKGDTGSLAGQSLDSLNTALAAATARRFAAEERFRQGEAAGITTEASASSLPLRAQLADLNAQYQQKLKIFRPEYPEMQQLKAQVDALKSAISSETSTSKSERVGSLRADYQAALAEERELRGRVDQLANSVLDLRGRQIKYTILQRDVDTNRALYDALLQRYKQIGVAGGIGNANASVVDRGDVPGGAFSPNLYLNLIVGGALGLLGGLMTALALEFVNDTIKSPDDIRDKLGVPFLGGVPPAKIKPIDELKEALSPVAEAYLSTATALQFVTDAGTPKTLLVTSTRAAEGKSTSAWGIAQSYARLGKNVLLIDADMRRPAFVTGQDDVGLSLLLTNTTSLSDHVLRTEVDNLWIMPSGPIPPSPPELVASARFAALLTEAAATFDLVVVDAPPILGLADAPLISTVAQATLLVIESGRTRTRAAVEAHNRLRTAGSHVIGAILTRYQAQTAYGYGYSYGQKHDSYRYVSEEKEHRQRILLTVHRE